MYARNYWLYKSFVNCSISKFHETVIYGTNSSLLTTDKIGTVFEYMLLLTLAPTSRSNKARFS